MLSKEPMSYSEMLEVLGVSNSFLTYHLENLGELVGKMDDGRYRLSTFGEDAMATMTRVEDIPVNTPHQSPQTKPKKIVWKSVPIALGLICIVLIAFIAYFAVAGISAQNSYNNLQNQNNQLQTWLDGNQTLLNQTQADNNNLQNQVASLNRTISSLTSNLTNLQEIVNMQESAVLWNASMDFGSTSWNIFLNNYPNGVLEANPIHTDYAGYVAVSVINSTSSSTYLGLSYSSNGFSYDNTVSIGSSGSTIFPILPTTSLSIGIATGTSSYLNITNVTIIYYY